MADIRLSNVVGGGLNLKPISLDFKLTSVNPSWVFEVEKQFGAQITAGVVSSTLTEVLNIDNPTGGFFTFMAAGDYADINTMKCRIVRDGFEIINAEVSKPLGNIMSIEGVFNSNTDFGTESMITFDKTFVVEVAGDGVDPSYFAYKRVLT